MIDVLLFLLMFIVSYLISGVIHELGHILAGLLQGFKFFLLVVGPFGLKRNEDDRIVFYIEKNYTFWGGIGGVFPQNEDNDSFEKFGKVLLFGPLTSIIFGLLMLPLAILTDSNIFVWLSAMPIGMGVASLIPGKMGAFYTDGGRWLRMKREHTRKVELALWNVIRKAGFNENYADINLDDVCVLINDKEQNIKYLGHYFLYLHYKEKNNIEQVEKQKYLLKELSSQVSKQMLKVYPVE
ncbi:zinc metalloprotease [Candidatus Contubernalis alkaliaceticus]|uniref:hypothetical protein n=1 Tax=Candidatus Contubernalis alkaliaceticus TaxID=338645 RepID=UPI001F4BD657|nr:hypothetical protein [Candidatus Contubernalis alkalaceticus]UNC92092.1 hypothetical protein HUE98_08275 [Candidatus Contubernalis alkalaceticus]